MEVKKLIAQISVVYTKHKKLVILVICILLVGIFAGKSLFSSANRMSNAIKSGDADKISKIYISAKPGEIPLIEEKMRQAAENIYDEYNQGKYSEDAAEEVLNLFADLTGKSIFSEINDQFTSLKESKNAFSMAQVKEKTQKEEALEAYMQVIKEDTYYEEAQSEIVKIQNEIISEGIENADELIKNEEYETAYDILDQLVKKYIGESMQSFMSNKQNESEIYQRLNEKIDEVCSLAISYYDNQINECEKDEKYLDAIALAEEETLFDYDKQLNLDDKIEYLYTEYFNMYISQAEAVFIDPEVNYTDALEILQPIREQYPDQTILEEKCRYYESFEPVSLLQVEPYDEGTWWNGSGTAEITDNTGIVRKPGFWMGGIYLGGAYWRVDKQYDVFKAVVCVPAGYQNDLGCNGRVIIYGDDEVLWSQEHMDGATKPVEVKIDISNVDVLEIYMSGGSAPLVSVPVCVSDPVVQRINK